MLYGKHNIILINMICDSESVSQCHCQGGCPLGISNERPPPPPRSHINFQYARLGCDALWRIVFVNIAHSILSLASARSCCTRLVCSAACAPWDALAGDIHPEDKTHNTDVLARETPMCRIVHRLCARHDVVCFDGLGQGRNKSTRSGCFALVCWPRNSQE